MRTPFQRRSFVELRGRWGGPHPPNELGSVRSREKFTTSPHSCADARRMQRNAKVAWQAARHVVARRSTMSPIRPGRPGQGSGTAPTTQCCRVVSVDHRPARRNPDLKPCHPAGARACSGNPRWHPAPAANNAANRSREACASPPCRRITSSRLMLRPSCP